ncbi:helix-turn-helix domain-containing protein [Agrococcus sp. 1P02AA]|uniref:helix-turn-helix transcriptional regulator n=1 Tax=Agrococcus sp. 1P02AA TaxID=3132259 RepID=UPI0039A42BC6
MEKSMETLLGPDRPSKTAYVDRMTTTTIAPPPLDLYATSPGTLLTEAQLAAALGIAQKTARSWRSLGKGPAWRNLGGALVRYRAGDVVAWMDSHRG